MAAETGTLLCLDVPPGSNFGLDTRSWAVGPKFRGVTRVPPGVHFLSVGAKGQTPAESGMKEACFFEITAREVVVLRWDAFLESLRPLSDQEEAHRYSLGVQRGDFRLGLAPYPEEQLAAWRALSSHVTPLVVKKVQRFEQTCTLVEEKEEEVKETLCEEEAKGRDGGEEEKEDAVPKLDTSSAVQQGANQQKEDERKEDFAKETVAAQSVEAQQEAHAHAPLVLDSPGPRRATTAVVWHFSAIPPPSKQAVQGALLSKLHLDRTDTLDALVRAHWPRDGRPGQRTFRVLGELQCAFVAFLCGQQAEGFEQWKQLLLLLCSCEHGALAYTNLFIAFTHVLIAQLHHIPVDFFRDPMTAGSFLKFALHDFLEICSDPMLQKTLHEAVGTLSALLKTRFGWDFAFERLTDPLLAPTIVTQQSKRSEQEDGV